MNLFNLFLFSNQKHPLYHHIFQRAMLVKFLVQFNSICILWCHCLRKFSGSHFKSIMVSLLLFAITCYFYLGKLIHFNIQMPLLVGNLSWYFSKCQLAYMEYLCNRMIQNLFSDQSIFLL